MAQFTLYRNNNKQTRANYPYLLDVQAELLQSLKTRLVVPAINCATGPAIDKLNPLFTLGDEQYLLLIQQMAGIPVANLGETAADLSYLRTEIVAAIDILITGI
ncbi:plasmid maintenance protein CcdB [Methylomonas methanica]|uniref:Toxin CcdB n=1 Tax=Methylomonas methanica TaxID=421 RepID=A0A177MLT0_METMH|nr:CcdB family protein [Methylomonas methanica]OAI06355.1 plasmid maintenance protein CcdB [Methylomonas methanica]